MTNSATQGNEVVTFERAADGSLSLLDAVPTGGVGSGPAPTSTVFGAKIPLAADGLGSQGSLILSADRQFLFAVNAGSDSVNCSRVNADKPGPLLSEARTAASGGKFSVSLTFRSQGVAGGLLFVLNAGGDGNITGFRVDQGCGMTPIPGGQSGSLAALVDDPPFPSPAPNEVRTTPAQVGFTPNGRELVVTIKGGPAAREGDSVFAGGVAVFTVDMLGVLATSPTVTKFAGRTEPTGFTFDQAGHLILTQMKRHAVASFTIDDAGRLVPTGESIVTVAVNCWIARGGGGNRQYKSQRRPTQRRSSQNSLEGAVIGANEEERPDDTMYAMSFGSIPVTTSGLPDGPGEIRAFRVDTDGRLRAEPGVAATLPQDDPGMISATRINVDSGLRPESRVYGNHGIDIAVVGDERRDFLYALEPRLGLIGAWEINADGTLRPVGHFGGRGLKPGVDPFAGTNPGINDFVERCFLQKGTQRSPECEAGSI